MKKEISSLELHYLIKELKVLEGCKVDRIYHAKEKKNIFIITIHKPGHGKMHLNISLPGMVYISSDRQESGTPTGLCMMLRKYLEGAFLKTISQKDFERVLELKFETKMEGKLADYILIIELFSKGNIIFCDNNYAILNIFEEQHWSDRELKKGEIYKYPKSKHGDVREINKKDFIDIIKNSDRDSIVKSLAMDFSLGGVYAEEICKISDVDKDTKINKLEDKKIPVLYINLQSLFNKDSKANLVDKNVFPFELEIFSGKDKKYYETFNDAIKDNIDVVDDKENVAKKKNKEKLMLIISGQQENLEETEKAYAENQEKAEAIYAHYQEIDSIIKAIKKAREKYSWKEIKTRISNDPKLKDLIKNIDEKTGEITIEIKE